MLVKDDANNWVPSQPPSEPVVLASKCLPTVAEIPLYLTPLEEMVFAAFKVAVVSMKALGLSPSHHEHAVQDFTLQLTQVPLDLQALDRAYDLIERCIREVSRLAYVPKNSDDVFLLQHTAAIRANAHPPLTQFNGIEGFEKIIEYPIRIFRDMIQALVRFDRIVQGVDMYSAKIRELGQGRVSVGPNGGGML